MTTPRWGHLSSLLLLASACATAKPPVALSKSEAYRELSQAVRALLERDLDGNGLTDVVAVVRVGPGFVPRQVQHHDADGDAAWRLGCVGPVVEGDVLDTLTWTRIDNATRDLLLIVAVEDSPEELVQSVALVDMLGDCTIAFADRVALPKVDTEVLAPGPVPGGVVAGPEGGVLLVDDPDFLTLQGAGGDVQLLLGVRERRIAAAASRVSVAEAERRFLVRRRVSVHWQPQGGEILSADELVDGREDTAFVARAGESGTLRVRAAYPQEPLLLLDLSHGCTAGQPQPLELSADSTGVSYVTGERPASESAVRAAGRTQHTARGFLRDLIVVASPAAELALVLGPVDVPRCVREIRGYGWRPLPRAAQAAIGAGQPRVVLGTSP